MFIAIALKGKEYMYKARTRLEVSEKKVEKILEVLNTARYYLKDGEVWHPYEGGYGDVTYGTAMLKRTGDVKIRWEARP